MMKKTHLIMSLCFSAVVAFTLFIYEPIVMYSGNIDEFWFDLGILVSVMVWPFLITFASMVVFYILCFLIFRKKPMIFYGIEIASFAGFVYLYFHGNFLTNMLPTLYGDKIDWWGQELLAGHIISIVLFVVIIALIIWGVKKNNAEKVANYSFYAAMVFSVMMLVSFITSLTTPGLYVDKEIQPVVTMKGINDLSSDKNFYILLVDCTDSMAFNEYVEKKYSDDFKDFVYFDNSAPGYSLTRDSLPLIFTGEYNRNEEQFNTFSTKAFDNSELFEKLLANGYVINFYSTDLVWNSRKSMNLSNLNNSTKHWSNVAFVKQQVKYILYKYLPFSLKEFSKIESMDYVSVLRYDESELYDWKNTSFVENVLSKDYNSIDEKLFQFIHIEGAHSPYDMDDELNAIEEGSYSDKVGAAAKIADLTIERLKNAGVYDNSVIVIMSDHGWYTRDAVLYIKGFGEVHSGTKTESRPVSWSDLSEVFSELIDNKNAREAFENIPDKDRERFFYVNPYYDKEPMYEWVVGDDDCSDDDNWKKTGVEYPYPTI